MEGWGEGVEVFILQLLRIRGPIPNILLSSSMWSMRQTTVLTTFPGG